MSFIKRQYAEELFFLYILHPKMLSLNEKEIFEDYFMCEKSAREIQQANGGTLEGIRAAIRRIRKKARLVEQEKNYFILCILGTLLIIRQIIK